MKTILNFKELESMKNIENSDAPMNESFEDLKIIANKSKDALKKALKLKIKKSAPSLAEDDVFMKQLVASFAYKVG